MVKKNNDKCVYLLVGQRGAGKSHYAKRLLEKQTDLTLISRDEILLRKFGTTDLSPYGGAHCYVNWLTLRLLRFVFRTSPVTKIIFDCWTGSSKERHILIERLRECGATRVVALYFITSLEYVNVWFWRKPGIAKSSEWKERKKEDLVYFSDHVPSCDYDVFHQLAKEIDSDGFDEVIRINPLVEPIVLA